MMYFLKNLHLSVCSLSIDVVAKCSKYFFEGIMTMSYFIFDFPNMPICSTSYQLSDFVFLCDVRVDFFRHLNYKSDRLIQKYEEKKN